MTDNNSPSPNVVTQGRPIGHVYDFYLTGSIGEPREYIDLFKTLRSATPHDVIRMYINSFGGNAYTAVQFMKAMRDCPAPIVCHVEGMCHSAATFIMLSADGYEIADHSSFCFHNYSGGAFGKGHEILANVEHQRKWADHIARSVYEDFLTEIEISDMLSGKDIWMEPKEVHSRLVARAKLWDEQKAKTSESKKKGKKRGTAKS